MARGSFMTNNAAASSSSSGGGGITPVSDSTIINVTSVDTTAELQTLITAGNVTLTFDSEQTYNKFSGLRIDGDNVTMNLNGATVKASADGAALIEAAGGDNFRIENGRLEGFTNALTESEAGRTAFNALSNGILWASEKKLKVYNVEFLGFRDAGVRVGGISADDTTNADRRYHISSCEFYECFIGFVNEQDAEYGMITDCMMNACGIGGINNSGNWLWSNIAANYCGSGLVTVDGSSQYHQGTANSVRGAITNAQINHTNSGSKWSSPPNIQIAGATYSHFGYLVVGDRDSPVNGLSIFESDVRVLGNTSVSYQISDLVAEDGSINGGNDQGIHLTGFAERGSVIKLGNVYETVKQALSVIQHRAPKEVLLYNSNLDPSLSAGDNGLALTTTKYSDFVASKVDQFTLQAVGVGKGNLLRAIDNQTSAISIMKVDVTSAIANNMNTYGGYVEFTYQALTNRPFGGFFISPPIGNFNLFVAINAGTIGVHKSGGSGGQVSTLIFDNTSQIRKIKIEFEPGNKNQYRVFVDGVDQTGLENMQTYSSNWNRSSDVHYNAIGWTSGSTRGNTQQADIYQMVLAAYSSSSKIIIPVKDYNINYHLDIPPSETRSMQLQIPATQYQEGVQLSISNKCPYDAIFVREDASTLIRSGANDLIVKGTTAGGGVGEEVTLTSDWKGFDWN